MVLLRLHTEVWLKANLVGNRAYILQGSKCFAHKICGVNSLVYVLLSMYLPPFTLLLLVRPLFAPAQAHGTNMPLAFGYCHVTDCYQDSTDFAYIYGSSIHSSIIRLREMQADTIRLASHVVHFSHTLLPFTTFTNAYFDVLASYLISCPFHKVFL